MKTYIFSLLWDCNQKCVFCAKGEMPAGAKRRYSREEAEKVILAQRAAGCDILAFDGGEPTLLPYLPDLAALALRSGYKWVRVATNAVALSDKKLAAAFAACHPEAAKKVRFGVSLHSHEARVSDRLTGAPGTFARSLAGLRNLRAAGFATDLYHVITAENYRGLPAFASFVLEKLPWTGNVTFSFIMPSEHLRPRMGIYPKITQATPYLARAMARLRAAGMRFELSSCGTVPFCLLGGERSLFTHFMPEAGRAGETRMSAAFPFFLEGSDGREKVKAAACAGCLLDQACGGIWRLYAERHGTGELKACTAVQFGRLPAGGPPAVLDAGPAGGFRDPGAYLRMALVDLRWNGAADIALRGRLPGGVSSVELAAFAASLGCRLKAAAPGAGKEEREARASRALRRRGSVRRPAPPSRRRGARRRGISS